MRGWKTFTHVGGLTQDVARWGRRFVALSGFIALAMVVAVLAQATFTADIARAGTPGQAGAAQLRAAMQEIEVVDPYQSVIRTKKPDLWLAQDLSMARGHEGSS